MLDERALLSLSAAAADGQAPPASLAASSTPEDAALLNQLMLLSKIAGAALGPQPAPIRPLFNRFSGLELRGVLGHGSFGVVYRAHDPQLHRDVALKILSGPAVEDRIQEGRLLAKVRHPNVVAVYGANADQGHAGIWMELVEGRTLEEVLAAGPLPIREAVRIVRDLCGAVAAVHAAGLLHGDIKTQNVMLEASGRVVLMDFGASRLAHAGPLDDSRVAGTPARLAPEVLRGGRPSPAADVYAMGVLLFRLLTGEYPVEAASVTGLIRHHRTRRRQSIRKVCANVPEALEDVIERTLGPVRRRYRTATDLSVALDAAATALAPPSSTSSRRIGSRLGMTPVLASVVLLALVVAGHTWWSHRQGPRVTRLGLVALADLGQHRLADGVSAVLAERLGRHADLRVVTVPSGAKPVAGDAELVERLQVQAVLSGSVRIDIASTSLHLRLLGPGSAIRWEHEFAAGPEGLSGVLSDAVGALARELQLEDIEAEPGTVIDPLAYRAYLRGRASWNQRTPEHLQRARTAFEQAVLLEPTFAEAHAGLADAYTLLQAFGIIPKADALPRARAAALAALKFDPNLAEAHTALAYVLHEERDYLGSRAAYERALALNPSYATAHHWYALTIVESRPEHALAHIEEAQRLSPLSDAIAADVGRVLLRAGRHDDAVAAFARAVRLNPQFVEARIGLGDALTAAGRLDDAARELVAALDLAPHSVAVRMSLIELYGRSARQPELRRLARELDELAGETFVPPHARALAHACAGTTDEAFRWLAQSARENTATRNFLESPCFRELRHDPRYAETVQSVADHYSASDQ